MFIKSLSQRFRMEYLTYLQLDVLNFLVNNMDVHIETVFSDIIISNSIDSLNFVNMVIILEDKYGIEFPDIYLSISELNTVEKIAQVIYDIKFKEVVI